MGIKESISELRQKFDADLSEVRDSESIEKLRVSYLGKKGSVTELLKGLKDLSGAEKKEFGQTINTLKREVDERITAHVERIRQEEEDRLVNSAEQYDVTLPMDTDCGSYHPITLVQRELEEIFASMGFTIEDYREVVTDYNCFEALNIPKHHPARDMQDTYYLDNGQLLKTHTSAAQNTIMKKYGAPLRAIFPGRCFRNESTDASHENTFFQMEGIMIDKDISISNLIYFMKTMLSKVFKQDVQVRLRPGIGKSKAEMSFIMSASSLFGVVLIPIVGYINDKLRKPRLICTVMMACVAVFGILFALVRETMLLFLLNGCIMGFISSLSPVSERMATSTKYRYGTIRIWGTFGYAAAVQVACAMMEFTSPQLIFVSVSVSAVLVIVGFLGTDDISFTDTEAAKAAAGKQFSFLCAPMYILFVIIGFIFSGCSNLNMTYSPILLQELGMPTGAVGTVLFFSTIVELPVILFSYKFMDRFSGRTLMLLAFAIMVAQFLLYATAPNAFVAVVTMLVLRAIGSTLFGMILLKIVRGVVQVRSVSTALGVISATDAMSAILMQNLGGILVENTSIRILYFAMAGLMMLGMILTLFLRVQNTEKVFS